MLFENVSVRKYGHLCMTAPYLVVPVGSLVPSLSTVKMRKNKNKKTNVPVHIPSVGCNGITRQTYSQLIAQAYHSLITDIDYLHVQSWGNCSHAWFNPHFTSVTWKHLALSLYPGPFQFSHTDKNAWLKHDHWCATFRHATLCPFFGLGQSVQLNLFCFVYM